MSISLIYSQCLNAFFKTFIAGSMTIDCLGILTELSDCKRKLFPVGYQ